MDEPTPTWIEGLGNSELTRDWIHSGLEVLVVDTMVVFARQGLSGLELIPPELDKGGSF